MAIALRGTSTFGSTTAITSFTINTPTGTVDGDVMLWHIVGQVATLPASPPTGWTTVASGTTTAQYSVLYIRVASGEGATQTSPTLTSARTASTITTLSGVDTTTSIDVTTPALTAGTTAITFNAITPVTSGAWVMAFGATNRASGTAEGTMTSTTLDAIDVEGFSTAAAAVNVKSSVGHKAWTSGAFTPDMSNSTALTRSEGMTVAIRPASGGTNWTQTPTDTTGLTDTNVVDQVKVVDDPTGLTDTNVVDQAKVVDDPAGLTDTTAISQAKVVDDAVGMTDSATVENGKLVNQTDNTGLADTSALAQTKGVTDAAGMTDSVVLALFKVITDDPGLSDLAALTQGKTTTDNTGLTDSATVDLTVGSVATFQATRPRATLLDHAPTAALIGNRASAVLVNNPSAKLGANRTSARIVTDPKAGIIGGG